MVCVKIKNCFIILYFIYLGKLYKYYLNYNYLLDVKV